MSFEEFCMYIDYLGLFNRSGLFERDEDSERLVAARGVWFAMIAVGNSPFSLSVHPNNFLLYYRGEF